VETKRPNTEDSKTKVILRWDEVHKALLEVFPPIESSRIKVYGVPKNGMILTVFLPDGYVACSEPEQADIILDDLIDSGRTMGQYKEKYPDKPFMVLFDKRNKPDLGWIVFPWEGVDDPNDLVVRQIEMMGEDPTREGLLRTPERVVKSWEYLYSGYNKDPAEYLKTVFTSERTDEMIILKNIEFYSTCEHHLLPFFGRVHIGYIPKDGRVVGVSKLARAVECYSRRMQIQERLTSQIATAIDNKLEPEGVGVVVEAQHLCMMARGVEKQNSVMTTSAMYGAFREKPETRSEFLNRIS